MRGYCAHTWKRNVQLISGKSNFLNYTAIDTSLMFPVNTDMLSWLLKETLSLGLAALPETSPFPRDVPCPHPWWLQSRSGCFCKAFHGTARGLTDAPSARDEILWRKGERWFPLKTNTKTSKQIKCLLTRPHASAVCVCSHGQPAGSTTAELAKPAMQRAEPIAFLPATPVVARSQSLALSLGPCPPQPQWMVKLPFPERHHVAVEPPSAWWPLLHPTFAEVPTAELL